MSIQEWIEAYRRAWEAKDEEAAASLFTADAVYRDHPFGEPHLGRDRIRAYWRTETSTQHDIHARFGEPIVGPDGCRAAVEFWVTMVFESRDITLTGILILNFAPDGLCGSLWEAWHYTDGHAAEPFPAWGALGHG